jgi:hypothetical protein
MALALGVLVAGASTTWLVSTAATTPTKSGTKLAVFIGNDKNAVTAFENWLGQKVDGVLAYTGSQNWNGTDPGWQLSSDALGGTGRELFWSMPMMPDGSGAAGNRDAAAGKFNDLLGQRGRLRG